MKTKLITALRTAAKALEDGTFAYDWNHPSSCNCGVIASTLMHKSISEIRELSTSELMRIEKIDSLHPNKDTLERVKKDCSWTARVQSYCPVTGLSEHVIIRELQQAGLTANDIVQLEKLSNPEVCERAGITIGIISNCVLETRNGKAAVKKTKSVKKNRMRDWLFHGKPREEVMEIESVAYADKCFVIRYMRAWADLLTEQGKMDSIEATEVQASAPA